MLKVLVNAYAISPDHGSEPGMGWNWCVRLAKECELFIITEGEFREGIERKLATLPQAGNMHFYYLPVSNRVRRMCWNQGDWRFYYHYAWWQWRALALARDICANFPIDVIHQLNMVGFREPGFLWRIKGKKYIWGPIGGMGLTPAQYFRDAPFPEYYLIRWKNVINRFQRKHSLRVRKAVQNSSVVLCATPDEYHIVTEYYRRPALLINETGTTRTSERFARNYHAPYHLIWVGKFVHRKQLGLALRAIAQLDDIPVVLDVVGTGSDKMVALYRTLAARLKIEDRVVWHGQLTRDEVDQWMERSDLFLFTSVSEATSTVMMEAISKGLPVICFDTCGFGPIVDDEIGVKIPLTTTTDESVCHFAEAIRQLLSQPSRLSAMSEYSFERSKSLTWDEKVRIIMGVYQKMTEP